LSGKRKATDHLKRPYNIILATIAILGVAALVLVIFVQDKQIKLLKAEMEAAKAKAASDFAKYRMQGFTQLVGPKRTKSIADVRHIGHLWGDVLALIVVGAVLASLMPRRTTLGSSPSAA
jgi:hypothetical protein